MSPTARTLKRLREEGWEADVCERWIPGARIRKDLFGLLDIVSIRDTEILGIQCTTLSNLNPRIQKFADSQNTSKLRRAGFRLECWGWRKLKTGWTPKIVDVS